MENAPLSVYWKNPASCRTISLRDSWRRTLKFTKMHGAGNDYIYVNAFAGRPKNPSEAAIALSRRHFGIGSDGLILICPSEAADFRMEMYNADGSQGKMCGNGIRCVGKYVYDHGMTDKTHITVETPAGIKTLDMQTSGGRVRSVRVDMGRPELDAEKVPVLGAVGRVIDRPVTVRDEEYRMTCVSMGNPHCVVRVADPETMDLERIGPAFENLPIFPDRVNTEFIRIINRSCLQMRVWERGSGETLACGTGACASVVAAILNGWTDRCVTVRLRGGDLKIEWDEQTDTVYLTGPAETVFEGETEGEWT